MTALAYPTPRKLYALIREARRRARLRRFMYGAAVLVAAVATAVLYTEMSQGSLLPACGAGDYGLRVGAQPSTGNFIGGVRVVSRASSACRFDEFVRMAVMDKSGAAVVHPASWHLGGNLSRAHDLLITWRYGPWCDNPALTFSASVAGGPAARLATPPTNSCGVKAQKQLLRFRQPS